MRKDQRQHLEMFERAVKFIESNAERCKRARESGTYAELRAHVAEIREHLAHRGHLKEQRQAETTHFRQVRAALLRDHMAPVERIAAATIDPGRERKCLRMPPRWAGPFVLIRHANEMATESRIHKGEFLRAGLPHTFDEQLVAAAEALGRSVVQRGNLERLSAAETASIGERIRRGRAAVQVLDAMVRSEGAGDDSLVAAWRMTVLVGGRERRRIGSGGRPGTSLVRVAHFSGESRRSVAWQRLLESMRGVIAGVWQQLRVPRIGGAGRSERSIKRLRAPSVRQLPPGGS